MIKLIISMADKELTPEEDEDLEEKAYQLVSIIYDRWLEERNGQVKNPL
jgi:hypothetical protein